MKTANSGYLTRRLVDVAQDVITTQEDCQTLDGIEVTSLVEGGEIIEALRDRMVGRVALEQVIDPFTGETLVDINQEIDEDTGCGHSGRWNRENTDSLGSDLQIQTGAVPNVLWP